METLFTPDVVDAVRRHMNDDHRDDALLICRSLGGRPDATSAETTGVDAAGIEFAAAVPEGTVTLRVPWSEPVTERRQVRLEVVRMYRQACAALGVTPRAAAEH
ncbi:DUF2470 domain-containing protein [Rhizohabitans arisaemae]|uniref:DUF2470 domain-containing protein n=1 Tax=Rhizohabitans arisaemae TaxID=2720610 RepID=UPI0024B15971|nr:DUF2470 domain-containing protein [Rhizohabitans arisaemae]